MAINKKQSVGIESVLKSVAPVRFMYQGHEVDVMKIRTSETKMAYILVHKECVLLGFLKEHHKDYNSLSDIFLRKKLVYPYAHMARKITRERGGKSFLKRRENRYLTEKTVEVTDIFFPTARIVVMHFRKIKGLDLTAVTFDSLNSAIGGDDA